MSESALTVLIYTGAGLLAVALIFGGALWFANAARRGNSRFKWAQRRAAARADRREDARRSRSG